MEKSDHIRAMKNEGTLQNLSEFENNLFGMVVSFIIAYLTIDFFIKFIDRIGFMPFIIYRIVLGALILFFLI